MKSRIMAAATAIVLMMCAAGCGGKGANSADESLDVSEAQASDIPADGTQSADGLTTKDYQTGTLPTDPYRMVNPDLRDYALNLFIAKCMVEKGLTPPPVTAYDWNNPAASKTGGWSHRLTIDEATQYGYHLPPVSDIAKKQREAGEFIVEQSSEWNSNFDACYEAAGNDPLFQETISDDLPFSKGTEQNPLITEAMTKWRECMKPLGIPDLPEDSPGLAPSLSAKFDLDGADNDNLANLNTVSAEEITIATQDARCDSESGYDTTKYGLTWLSRDRYLKANLSDLTARRAAIQQQEDALKTYIEENRDSIL